MFNLWWSVGLTEVHVGLYDNDDDDDDDISGISLLT